MKFKKLLIVHTAKKRAQTIFGNHFFRKYFQPTKNVISDVRNLFQ